MTIAVPARAFNTEQTDTSAAWKRRGAMLAGVATILLALFWHDSADLARIWWTSTTFGHCLFIGPVIGWLVWQRRSELAQIEPVGWAPGLAIVAVGGFGWMLGDAAQVSLARHLGLLIMLQGSVVTMLGPQVARGLLFPLAYAFFLVPFGESLEAPLQGVTVAMTMKLLHLVGVPAVVDGVLITIPNGYFEVAEACSGAKFVIAMTAYGVLVAHLCYLSWGRRIVFMAMALIVPVIANGLRAFGTIYAAHLTSVEAATGFDHIVYGWVFFGLVMAAVLAIGWRWFDRDPAAPMIDVARLQTMPRRPLEPLLAAALVLTVAAVFPSVGAAMAQRIDRAPDMIALPEIAGWQRAPLSARAPWQPHYPGADRLLIGRYVDPAGTPVDLAITVYDNQREGKEIVGFGIGALREDDRWVKIGNLPDIDGGAAMRVTAPGPVERVIVTWYRLGATRTSSPRTIKLAALGARLFGGPQRAVAVHVSAEALPGVDPQVAIARFLAALGSVDRVTGGTSEPPR
ncbi:MAG: exosortase [Sphingomonas sp. 28-66-16]|nr:MAG: exosortase [Sphingomonas sp. 28-66-16]